MPRDLRALTNTTAEGVRLDRRIYQRMRSLAWPGDDPVFRWRMILTAVLLILAALLNALVPLLFARAIDRLAVPAALALPVGLLLAYVGFSWLGKVFNELRWALYAPIEQR